MSESAKQAPPIADEIAVIKKDIDVTDGFFLENPDPTILTESKGKGLKLYDEIDRDAHAGSVLQTRYLSVSGEKWEINVPDDTPRSKEIGEFVTKVLKDCNLMQAVQELMQAILYGYYVAEIIWEEKNKTIVPAKILAKHPRRFGFTKDRELRMYTKDSPREGEQLPIRKFITFTFGASDNPYGKGLGQRIWWPVWFKKHGIKFWLIFLDKFGMPTGVGKYPNGAEEKDKKTLLEAVDAIHSETGVTIPENMSIELLEASRSGKVTYESLCEYMDLQISKAVLGQTLTTEVKGGSLAASQTHDDVRHDIKEADAGLIASCLNETLIPWLIDFNFTGVTAYPKFRYITEKEETLKDMADRDEVLVNKIGVLVDDDYWYDTYNLPRPAGGGGVVRPETTAAPQFSEADRTLFSGAQQPLEHLGETAASACDLQHNETQILKIIEAAESYDEAMENLLEFFPSMDMSSIQTGIEKAMFNANMHGRLMVKHG